MQHTREELGCCSRERLQATAEILNIDGVRANPLFCCLHLLPPSSTGHIHQGGGGDAPRGNVYTYSSTHQPPQRLLLLLLFRWKEGTGGTWTTAAPVAAHMVLPVWCLSSALSLLLLFDFLGCHVLFHIIYTIIIFIYLFIIDRTTLMVIDY